MGHWDHHGIELRVGETAESLVQALPRSHGFHANGVFTFRDTQWVHVGWDDANAVAYRALVHFCLTSDRCWITSYANDPRAFLDATYFGWDSPRREERLNAVFGPPQQTASDNEAATPDPVGQQ